MNHPNRFLGCDPDTHSCAFAMVDAGGIPVWVSVLRVDKGFKHMDAAHVMCRTIAHNLCLGASFDSSAVEAQEIVYSQRQGTNPRSMLPVSVVAGAALAVLSSHRPENVHGFSFPLPAEWKGQVPKQIHQARLCSALGWDYEAVGANPSDGYVRPTKPEQQAGVVGADKLNKGDWKHVLDAIGLARYAREKYLYMRRVEANRHHVDSTTERVMQRIIGLPSGLQSGKEG